MYFRDLRTHADFRRVVEIEREVWGYTDAEDVVPVPILVITVKRGGILIGAFDEADRMVGFAYSLPGLRNGRPTQWSHMLGVIDRYRNTGLGRRLKLEQRRRALEMGLDLIEWTFDPLQAVNAHLNLARLGVVVREYEENIYGESSSPLHRGTPTDRFVAEWWIRSPRVERCVVAGSDAALGDAETDVMPAAIRTRPAGPWVDCVSVDVGLEAPRVAVEIPMGFSEMLARAPELGQRWRLATRKVFTSYFGRGYQAVDFRLDRQKSSGRYVLETGSRAAA